MNNNVLIGLEIHAQMNTFSKMFSSSPVTFKEEPNSRVSPIDIAFPGAMPLVNKRAIINAIMMCNALHMHIDNELWFDRKNYFYHDLPKGYQITQKYRPIGRHGYVEISNKIINIIEIHLEEDTSKQIDLGNNILLDYNRSGIPLLEIVSDVDISNGQEAVEYVEEIRSLLIYLGISNGNMSEGSLRVDVNISLDGNNKVEIKNINTLENIKNAIDYEIKRQQDLIDNKKIILKETRKFDEDNQITISMRRKAESIDYNYTVGTNIAPIKLSEEFIKEAIDNSPETKKQKIIRYKNLGLSEEDIYCLTKDVDISNYYDELIKYTNNFKEAVNWINVEVQSILKKIKIKVGDLKITPKELSKIISLVDDEKISHKQGREILFEVALNHNDLDAEISKIESSLINDEREIKSLIKEIIDDNPSRILDYHNGKTHVVSYVVGQLLNKTHGKVNPRLANKLVLQELQRRK